MAAWLVEGRLLGKDNEKSANISGIACTTEKKFPRSCMVIDDELQHAQLVTLQKDHLVAGRSIPLVDDSFSGKPLPLDGEGVAYADSFFYVMGSHGHPRDRGHKLHPMRDALEIEAKIMASSKIVRIPAASPVRGTEVSYELRHMLRCDPVLGDFADQRLDENGITIEGVAVRGGRLFAGFRAPVLSDGSAVVLSASVAALFNHARPDPELHALDLKRSGIRDLSCWAEGLLVLAGPSGGEEGPYSIHFWKPGKRPTRLGKLKDVPGQDGKQSKAEAILPIGVEGNKLRVLVFFDGAENGAPQEFRVTVPRP